MPKKNRLRDDEIKATDELRDKLKSKMDVAKFFAGFITLLVGFLLQDGVHTGLAKAGLICLSASLAFCVASVFAYDCLLMPREYWTALRSDEQNEHGFQDKLQEQMLHSWKRFFVPAVYCFGAGFLLVLGNAFDLKLSVADNIHSLVWAVLLVLSVAIPALIYKNKGPSIYD